MNDSLSIIANNWDTDRPLNPAVLQAFVEELHALLKRSVSFSPHSSKVNFLHTPIMESIEESIKSSTLEDQPEGKESKPAPYHIKLQSDSNEETEIDII